MNGFSKQYQDACAGVLDELKRTLDSIDSDSVERLAQAVLEAD